jgi:O-antigen/teichoic acid export membrane protein
VGVGVASLLSVLTGTGLYALAYPIAQQVFHAPQLAPILQLASVFVPLLTLSDVLAGANRGFKRMDYPVIAQFISQPIIRLILIVGFAFLGLNALHAVIAYGMADLAASFILLYFLNKQFSLRRPMSAARRDVKDILVFSLPVWLSELMAKFQNNLQTLVLGTMNTVTGVGIFSVASQLTMVSGQFSSSINVSAKPIIAELHQRGDIKQLGRIYQTTNKWSLMVQLPVFLTLVLFPAPILSIFGQSFSTGATALAILAWADLINVGTGMGGIIIDMTGYTKLKLVNSVLRLAIYLGLSFLLIPRWGLVGAAVVAMVGEGFVNLLRLIEVFFLFRLLPYNQGFIKPLGACILSFLGVYGLGLWIPPGASPVNTVINVLVLFLVYIAASLILGLSEEERAMVAILGQRARSLVSRG